MDLHGFVSLRWYRYFCFYKCISPSYMRDVFAVIHSTYVLVLFIEESISRGCSVAYRPDDGLSCLLCQVANRSFQHCADGRIVNLTH
jgi:hypothetical protein